MRRPRPGRGDGCDSHDSGRVLPWLLAVVVLVVAALGGAWYVGALDRFLCEGGTCGAADVAPPRGLDLPDARAASPVLAPAQGPALDRAKVQAALAPVVASRAFGPELAVAVRDLSSEQDVYAYGRGGTSLVPASTLKLFTTAAALSAVGPGTRFATTVRRVDAPTATPSGSPSAGPSVDATPTPTPTPAAPTAPARITLVGGGDPLLLTRPQTGDDVAYPRGRATLRDLAVRTAAALREDGVTSVTLGYDDTLFSGPGESPRWEPGYVDGDVATTVSALWTDEGLLTDAGLRSRVPALDAARTFARLLAAQGLTVTAGDPARVPAPTGADAVASVSSPTVEQIVQHTLEASDNESAEVLLRHVAIAEGQPATFDGGAAAVRQVLARLGVPWAGNTVVDGSGLSRQNRVTAASMLALLGLAAQSPGVDDDPEVVALRGIVSGLPVAGLTGSLADRFTSAPSLGGLGLARAKTGTLTGVHSLAGVTVDAAGTPLAFVALADRVRPPRTLDARAQLDRVAGVLTTCACSA